MRILVIIIVAMAFIVGGIFFSKIPHYEQYVLIFFAVSMFLKLAQNLYANYLYKNKKINICEGKIISIEKKYPHEAADINYTLVVNFESPYDHNKYIIKSSSFYKPRTSIVYVIPDKKLPLRSRVLKLSPKRESLYLAIAIIVLVYLAVFGVVY
jgi:hypothetical protein